MQHNLNARKYSILYPHTAPPLGTTESSFSFDPPPSPRSARSAEKSSTLFSFDPIVVASNEPHISNKSFKSRANVENKENVRTSDNGRSGKNANKTENGSGSKKERRSFKCERLSNIFSTKDSSSPNKEKNEMSATKTRKINSAPVYRKNSSISQSKFDNDDESSSTGTSSDLTMFPFDREAIDYERIQRECFAVEEEFDNNAEYQARKSFPYDYDTEDSPSYEMLEQKGTMPEGIFQQYAILSQLEKERQSKKRAQSPAAEMKTLSKIEHINRKLNETSVLIHDQPSSNVTSPIPDLKIDFFTESSLTASSAFSRENKTENSSDALDGCQKDATSSFSSKSNNNTNSNKSATNGSINLTSNPMSTAVVTTPRATIVVQQVCYQASVLTFFYLLDSCVLCFSSIFLWIDHELRFTSNQIHWTLKWNRLKAIKLNCELWRKKCS